MYFVFGLIVSEESSNFLYLQPNECPRVSYYAIKYQLLRSSYRTMPTLPVRILYPASKKMSRSKSIWHNKPFYCRSIQRKRTESLEQTGFETNASQTKNSRNYSGIILLRIILRFSVVYPLVTVQNFWFCVHSPSRPSGRVRSTHPNNNFRRTQWH
jgi:hypothetical protein